jgi:hypothetical protein
VALDPPLSTTVITSAVYNCWHQRIHCLLRPIPLHQTYCWSWRLASISISQYPFPHLPAGSPRALLCVCWTCPPRGPTASLWLITRTSSMPAGSTAHQAASQTHAHLNTHIQIHDSSIGGAKVAGRFTHPIAQPALHFGYHGTKSAATAARGSAASFTHDRGLGLLLGAVQVWPLNMYLAFPKNLNQHSPKPLLVVLWWLHAVLAAGMQHHPQKPTCICTCWRESCLHHRSSPLQGCTPGNMIGAQSVWSARQRQRCLNTGPHNDGLHDLCNSFGMRYVG